MRLENQFVPKGWGYELWIVNNEKYCGKLLVFVKGRRCSVHYHKIKEETFHLISGKVVVNIFGSDNSLIFKEHVLEPGDTFHLKPGTKHQIIALLDSTIIEISTHHSEDDSYRTVKGD